jgi:hypothetical protein
VSTPTSNRETQRRRHLFPTRLAVLLGLVGLSLVVFAVIDVRPNLEHLDVELLSGPKSGAYYALAEELGAAAQQQQGEVAAIPSQGSQDNLTRLASDKQDCKTQFALVQDGITLPPGVELIARLPKSESVFFLGRDAAKLTRFAQLQGMTIGIGPARSGSDHLARQLFALPDLAALGVVLRNHGVQQQLDMLAAGKLALGIFVIDEDASLIHRAVTEHRLELASFEHLDVVARRFPYLWHGRIGTGQFDSVKLIPPRDKRVLRVDTLVVGNGCATHAQTIGLLTLLQLRFPGLIEHQRRRANAGNVAVNRSASDFFAGGGPDIADKHVPWLVDIMPPSSWAYVVMALSVLFNIMAFGHRFRLWRIDANRVRIDHAIREALGTRLTPQEIHDLEPQERHLTREVRASIDKALQDLRELRTRCRKQSVSMLVPMGQEMAYRYQEDQIEEALAAVRHFVSRLGDRD